MTLTIRKVCPEDHEKVYHFQCEYLDNETYEAFLERVDPRSGIYLVAFAGDELAGICYGQPSDRKASAFCIQGIAVSLDPVKGYARKGIGSKLLAALGSIATETGYKLLDVGAADDERVEAFYITELERVRIKDYESGKADQQRLRERHMPDEVIFIFKRQIK